MNSIIDHQLDHQKEEYFIKFFRNLIENPEVKFIEKPRCYGRPIKISYQGCDHVFPPDKVYKDGKLIHDHSHACFRPCECCGELLNRFD